MYQKWKKNIADIKKSEKRKDYGSCLKIFAGYFYYMKSRQMCEIFDSKFMQNWEWEIKQKIFEILHFRESMVGHFEFHFKNTSICD